MANIKSQIKRNRQNNKKRLRNRVYRGEARIAVKNARTTIEEGVPESKAALMQAISALDKAAEQGVIHRNNAARRKSRLVKAFARMVPIQVSAETAVVEPALETEPVKRKASSRKSSASSPKAKKMEEPKAEAAAEPVAESKASSSKAKKPAVKKPAAKKSETAAKSSPKGKKTATPKKPANKK